MSHFTLGLLTGFAISTITTFFIAASALTDATVQRAIPPASPVPVAPPPYILPVTPADGSGTGP